MNDRADEIRTALLDRVLDVGHTVQYVPADVTSVLHRGQPYAYTVGRTLMDRPEFVVTGLPMAASESMLNELCRMDDSAAGLRAGAGGVLHGLMPEVRLAPSDTVVRVRLIRADASPLLGALLLFGLGRVHALQALWPRDGIYPDAGWLDQPIHPWGQTPLVEGDPYA